jgi:nucleoside-diphosphate-sugar epimerase
MTSSDLPLVVLMGGSGYIGTHIMLELHGKYQVAIIDISPPNEEAVKFVEEKTDGLPVIYHAVDLRGPIIDDIKMLRTPDCGIMLAALKSVNEAEEKPYDYIRENITMCVNSMEYLARWEVPKLIQASSAAVYHTDGHSEEPIGIYGYSKRVTEDICRKLLKPFQRLAILRYMNPIGTHPEVEVFPTIGVCHYLSKILRGEGCSEIFFNKGNCIRDFIHITDLASFHAEILAVWETLPNRVFVIDAGNGVPISVSTLLSKFGVRDECIKLVERASHEAPCIVAKINDIQAHVPRWWALPRRDLDSCLVDYPHRF